MYIDISYQYTSRIIKKLFKFDRVLQKSEKKRISTTLMKRRRIRTDFRVVLRNYKSE